MKILVPVKRVVDYNVKVRVKNLKVAVPLWRSARELVAAL
jgi:electron transfer flavoprotein alpha/beta subunit